MTKKWDGKSKGTVLGHRIFIFFIRKLGLNAAYTLLYFVALYYCFASLTNSKNYYYYFRYRQKFSAIKSLLSIYKGYMIFGKTLIDKTAISSGLRERFTYEFDGIEHIKELLQEKKGGIMISAHVGNFEIANHFFDDIDINSQINLVTTDAEHRAIKEYINSVTTKSNVKLILIQEDLSHIFAINKALNNGELVCFTGDRYVQASKLMEEKLLGKLAKFPSGPYILASRINAPVLFVYVMKEKNKHYHLYARKANSKKRDAEALLEEYTQSVSNILKKYPLQWFNYYDFWDRKST